MYWLVNKYTSQSGDTYYTYNYFEVVDIPTYQRPWYNGVTKQVIYPQTKQIIIKAICTASEQEFFDFYLKTKNI